MINKMNHYDEITFKKNSYPVSCQNEGISGIYFHIRLTYYATFNF